MRTIYKKSLLDLFQYCFCFMLCVFRHKACGILTSPLGIGPTPPALEASSITWIGPGKSLNILLLLLPLLFMVLQLMYVFIKNHKIAK